MHSPSPAARIGQALVREDHETTARARQLPLAASCAAPSPPRLPTALAPAWSSVEVSELMRIGEGEREKIEPFSVFSSLLSSPESKSPESERTCGLRRCEPGEQPRTVRTMAAERGWSRGSQRGPASCTAPGRCQRRRARCRSLSEPWATCMKRGSDRAVCRASPLRDSSAPGITRCAMNAVLYFAK